ncbi:MAG: hypothetical protein AAB363_02130, partial [Planctomycetota bacterium]
MSHCVTSATCKRWRGGARGGFKAAFDAEVVHEIEALIAPGAADRLDFEAVETAARRRALEVTAEGPLRPGPHFPDVRPGVFARRGRSARRFPR